MTVEHRDLKPPKCDACKGRCRTSGCDGRVRRAPTGRPREWCCEACYDRARRLAAKRARSRSNEWFTPTSVLHFYAARWAPEGFDLDPCAHPASPVWPLVRRRIYLGAGGDGLRDPWCLPDGSRGGVVWDNPPFQPAGVLGQWTERAFVAVERREVLAAVVLVPAAEADGWFVLARERGAVWDPHPGRIPFHELQADGTARPGSGARGSHGALVFLPPEVTARIPDPIDTARRLLEDLRRSDGFTGARATENSTVAGVARG